MEEEIQEAKRKYIRMFLEAQIMSQELKRGNDNIDKQGHVYLYPESTVGRDNLTLEETLTYIKYTSENVNEATFKKKIASNDSDIQNYFSINPEGQLVVATLIATTVQTSDVITDETEKNTDTSDESITTYEAIEVALDYKSMISQYATPTSFFLTLGMVTRNPEFLEEVVNLVKEKADIQLTVLNTKTTEVKTQIDTKTVHVRGRREEKNEEGEVIGTIPYESDTTITTKTITTTVTTTPVVKVTSVHTWLGSQKITYNKIPGTPVEKDEIIKQESDDSKSLGDDEIGEVSWTTREDSPLHTYNKIDSYDSGIALDYNIENVDAFIKLLDIKYTIPNSKEKRTAGEYLKTDAELFFHLLCQNPETQGMETMMRYSLNKYTESNKYGDITLEDIQGIYSANLINTAVGDLIVNTTLSEDDLVIKDVEKLKEAINATYSGQTKENLEQNANTFIQMQETYHVNAVFAIAVTIIESSGGTNWSAIAPETHNWMSVTGYYNGNTYKNPNSTNERTWRVYPSYSIATLDFGDLIKNSIYYFKANRNTVKTIAPTYCNAEWGNSVVAEMRKIYNSIGISTAGSNEAEGDGYTTTYTSNSTGRTYKEFKQNRGNYSSMIHGYSGGRVSNFGCNITSMAIVISGYGYDDVTPGTFAGAHQKISTLRDTMKYLKGTTGTYEEKNKSRIMAHLNAGKEVIINVNSTSSYTSSQHWMPLIDIEGEQVYVSNPYEYGNGSYTGWDNIDNVLKGLKCYILVSE